MLQQKLFQQLSEQIHQYAYGDSVHIRYIALYTSFNNLLVIAEDKYKLNLSIETLEWKQDAIASMKFQTFTLHILTMSGEYVEIILSNLFQQNTQQEKLQIIQLNDVLLPNNMKLKDVYQINNFYDFAILHKHKLKIAFISQTGQILFYNPDSKMITQIIALRQCLTSFQTMILENKELIVGITEFNDLIKIGDNDQDPQIHRFTDQNYSIKQIYFVGNKNILILQESKCEQRFVKYKLTKLKYVKKYYYLPRDDCLCKFFEIHELPKIFIASVFTLNQFQIICLSKRVMQDRWSKNIYLTFTNVIEVNNEQIDFNKLFYCPETSLTDQKQINGQIIHLSRFNQKFGVKITKRKINQVLMSDQHILDPQEPINQIENIDAFCSLLFTSTQISLIKITNDCNSPLNFSKLQHLENYQRTFPRIPQLHLTWQEKVIKNLWHHLNCEQGLKFYFQLKNEVSEEIHQWVNALSFNEKKYLIFNQSELDIITLDSQFDKCLATIALLNFKNLSNEISISRIISMIFNQTWNQCSKIVTENSNTFLQLIQCIKQNSNSIICYQYWQHSQQLLFILINVLDVWLANLMEKYNVVLVKSADFFEPLFINKARSLIVSKQVPTILRLKLIIFLQDMSFIKLFTIAIQTIEDRKELLEFSKICNITNDSPSLNVNSIQHIINDCDHLYLRNLIYISGNMNSINRYEPTKRSKNPAFGLIITSILTGIPNDYEVCKIINWFLC